MSTDDERDGAVRFCGACGARRDAFSTRFCRSCGTAYEGPVSTRDPASPAARLLAPKAGFRPRAAAYLGDLLILSVVGAAILAASGAAGRAIGSEQLEPFATLTVDLGGLAYFLFFWSGHGHGQTPGMRLVGLRVIRTDGSDLSVPRAFLRDIGLALSLLPLGLGILAIAWHPRKQGWHDRIAGTYVIRTT